MIFLQIHFAGLKNRGQASAHSQVSTSNYLINYNISFLTIILSENRKHKIKSSIILMLSPNPSLRFGLELCQEEERFLYERKFRLLKGMNTLLQDLPTQGPQTPDQVRIQSKAEYTCVIFYKYVFKISKTFK